MLGHAVNEEELDDIIDEVKTVFYIFLLLVVSLFTKTFSLTKMRAAKLNSRNLSSLQHVSWSQRKITTR